MPAFKISHLPCEIIVLIAEYLDLYDRVLLLHTISELIHLLT
jgi:hypothetical protein